MANLRQFPTVSLLTGVLKLAMPAVAVVEGKCMLSMSMHKFLSGTIFKQVPMTIICAFLLGAGTFHHLGTVLSIWELEESK